jgi:hypothetical protein
MTPIEITDYARYGTGNVKADVTEVGGVSIWIKYKDAPQQPTITLSPEEWDRFVAWVEWQRKDNIFSKKE